MSTQPIDTQAQFLPESIPESLQNELEKNEDAPEGPSQAALQKIIEWMAAHPLPGDRGWQNIGDTPEELLD